MLPMSPKKRREYFHSGNERLTTVYDGARRIVLQSIADGGSAEHLSVVVEASWLAASNQAVEQFTNYVSVNFPEVDEEDILIHPVERTVLDDIIRTIHSNFVNLPESKAVTGIELAIHSAVFEAYNTTMTNLFSQLVSLGLSVVKIWNADFTKATPPCAKCIALHGEAVPVGEAFYESSSTFDNGMYPPAHPRCRCYLTYSIGGNVVDTEDPTTLRGRESILASQIRKLSSKVFSVIVAAFRSFKSRFRRD